MRTPLLIPSVPLAQAPRHIGLARRFLRMKQVPPIRIQALAAQLG
jgi:hypothetical protein